MAREGLPRPIKLAFWIDVQHDPLDLVPVGPFRIRVEQAHVSDGVLLVVGSEHGIGGREIGDIGWHERSRVGKETVGSKLAAPG